MARVQIGLKISSAETVDGLLRIANHQECADLLLFRVFARWMDAINSGQGLVLPGIGILKFIHHGHRKLRANYGGQTTTWRMNCCMQPLQQIRKIKTGQTFLLLQIGTSHFDSSMLEQVDTYIGFGF